MINKSKKQVIPGMCIICGPTTLIVSKKGKKLNCSKCGRERIAISEPGICPYCKSKNIDYSKHHCSFCQTDLEENYLFTHSGNSVYFMMVCNDCDKISFEWYTLKFDETVGQEERSDE